MGFTWGDIGDVVISTKSVEKIAPMRCFSIVTDCLR